MVYHCILCGKPVPNDGTWQDWAQVQPTTNKQIRIKPLPGPVYKDRAGIAWVVKCGRVSCGTIPPVWPERTDLEMRWG